MNNYKMLRVLRGFASLEYEERSALLDTMQDYQKNIDNAYRDKLVKLYESRAGVPLGPTDEGKCPCCGR